MVANFTDWITAIATALPGLGKALDLARRFPACSNAGPDGTVGQTPAQGAAFVTD